MIQSHLHTVMMMYCVFDSGPAVLNILYIFPTDC